MGAESKMMCAVSAVAVASTLLSVVSMFMEVPSFLGTDPTPMLLVLAALCQAFTVFKSSTAGEPVRKFVPSAQQYVPSQYTAAPSRTRPMYAEGEESTAITQYELNEDSIQFGAGAVGFLAGAVVGGPVLGAVAGTAANYASKKDNEFAEALKGSSEAFIRTLNYVFRLDGKYTLLKKAQGSLADSWSKLKSNSSDPSTLEKVETAYNDVTKKLQDVDNEFDLVAQGMKALDAYGEFADKAINRAIELNADYKLSDQALEKIKGALDKN